MGEAVLKEFKEVISQGDVVALAVAVVLSQAMTGAGATMSNLILDALILLLFVIPAAIIEAWRARPLIDASATGLAPDDPAWDRWNPWIARERAEDCS